MHENLQCPQGMLYYLSRCMLIVASIIINYSAAMFFYIILNIFLIIVKGVQKMEVVEVEQVIKHQSSTVNMSDIPCFWKIKEYYCFVRYDSVSRDGKNCKIFGLDYARFFIRKMIIYEITIIVHIFQILSLHSFKLIKVTCRRIPDLRSKFKAQAP